MKITRKRSRLSSENDIIQVSEYKEEGPCSTFRFREEGMSVWAVESVITTGDINDSPELPNEVIKALIIERDYREVYDGKGNLVGELVIDGESYLGE